MLPTKEEWIKALTERHGEELQQAFSSATVAVCGLGGIWVIWRFRATNRLCAKVWGIFTGLLQGFSSCLRMERKWLFFAYTLFIWMVYWLMAATTVWAAPFLADLTVIDALFLSLVGTKVLYANRMYNSLYPHSFQVALCGLEATQSLAPKNL